MAVDDATGIDCVGVDKTIGEVVLTISDHLDWNHSIGHQVILQAKLNSYLAFVESGELLQKYPDAKNRLVAFQVVFKFPPDAQGLLFLDRAKAVMEAGGFTLTHHVPVDAM